ncbi:MAG: VOC family protein [bacterium]
MLNLDHTVIVVDDIEQATDNYRTLGFNVLAGGSHAGGRTANAVISFYDGSYIELLSFSSAAWRYGLRALARVGLLERAFASRPRIERRFLAHGARAEGLADLALLCDNSKRTIGELQSAGAFYEGPVPGGRRLPDGRDLAWEFAVPRSEDLPFLMSDVSARELRAPSGDACRHANGAGGIARVVIAVTDLDRSRLRFAAMKSSGLEPLAAGPTPGYIAEDGLRTAGFRLGSTELLLVESEDSKNELGRHLDEHGEGPYEIELRTVSGAYRGTLNRRLAHGARIRMIA